MPTAEIRQRNLKFLSELGFHVAEFLPLGRSSEPDVLRPAEEIAGRLLALKALFTWVAIPPQQIPDGVIRGDAEQNDLERHLTAEERRLFAMPRAEAVAGSNVIGWKLENMWPLAWVLGLERAPNVERMIGKDDFDAMMKFLEGKRGAKSLLAAGRLRPVEEVDAAEDYFYCAHNAARSAQLGGATVPPGWNRLTMGGVVQERRHALTWTLSPADSWDETDLNT